MVRQCLLCCFFLVFLVLLSTGTLQAQVVTTDSTIRVIGDTSVKTNAQPVKVDSSKLKKADTVKQRSPASKAALRSAILPGWGQAYNKKYWKMPIVYGALAVPVVTFTYNLKWYQKTRFAYTVKITEDTANYENIDPQLKPLSTESLRLYRNEFRSNMDFSVLAFLLLWGLQVVDAAVDGHLKDFNVNDDLSLRVNPGYSPMAKTNGLSVIMTIGKTASPSRSLSR